VQALILGEAPGKWTREGLLWDFLERKGVSRITCRTESALEHYYEGKVSKKILKIAGERVAGIIDELKPKVVLLLGNTPLTCITGKAGIKQRRGRPFEQDGVIYVPCYAPGLIMRDERNRPEFEADLGLFAEIIERGAIPREEGLNYTIVDTRRKFYEMLNALTGTVSFDIETTGLYAWAPDARVVSMGFGTRGRQWCFPLSHPEQVKWFTDEELSDLIDMIDERLHDCYVIMHNGKFDSVYMQVHFGVKWRPAFDTMLAHYILDENSRHGLKILAQVYYGAPNYDVDKNEKKGLGPLGKHCEYLAHDVYYTRKLRFTLGKMLSQDAGVQQVFDHILMPCSSLFCDIEYRGVYVDVARMDEVEEHLKKQRAEALLTLKKYGKDVNWGSPKQVAKLLFDDLGLEVLDKTKKGAPSCSESVLLRIDHPVANALLQYRAADKNLGTFINGWRKYIVNGRMHPSFKLHGTVTGRPSCEHPNLQQVPRDPILRSLIAAALGWELLDGDLSQIELRIAAELSGDPTMLGTFERDEDAHWLTATREIGRGGGLPKEVIETAKEWLKREGKAHDHIYVKTLKGETIARGYAEAIDILYRMGPDMAASINAIWKEMRKKAKAVNFGYLFGMWWKKFKIYARDNYGVIVTDQQAQDSRKAFFALYSRLEEWHKRQKKYARRNGYVRSLSGRKRRLPNAMLAHDCPERGDAERQAINSPVQSFASDLNLMILIQLVREFPDDVRPVGTVHDAILVEVRKEAVAKVYKRWLEIMEHPSALDELNIKIRVPIKGEIKIGPWSKGVSLEKWLAANAANDNKKKRKAAA
jgi:DNA polymerase I-like protein with 3'-5' exonuclease and polymerase domains